MEHQDTGTKLSLEKGTQTFFFATRTDLLECLNKGENHGVTGDKHRINRWPAPLAKKTRLV